MVKEGAGRDYEWKAGVLRAVSGSRKHSQEAQQPQRRNIHTALASATRASEASCWSSERSGSSSRARSGRLSKDGTMGRLAVVIGCWRPGCFLPLRAAVEWEPMRYGSSQARSKVLLWC